MTIKASVGKNFTKLTMSKKELRSRNGKDIGNALELGLWNIGIMGKKFL